MKKTLFQLSHNPIVFGITVLVFALFIGEIWTKATDKRIDPAQGYVGIDAVPFISSPVGQSELQLITTGTNSLIFVSSTGTASMIGMSQASALLNLGPLATLTPTGTASSSTYLNGLGAYVTIPASGTVNSVSLSLPSIFTINGSPVTSTGTLTGILSSQGTATFLASPVASSGIPSFRSIVNTDIPSPAINNNTVRSLVTTTVSQGFQVSPTRPATVHYSISTSTTATIGGASTATVFLETAATNSTTPSDWTTVATVSNQQTITLAVILQSVQVNQLQLTGMVPLGYYVRIRYVTSGTASVSYGMGQEVIW